MRKTFPLLFLALMLCAAVPFDYHTKHGIRVSVGITNAPDIELVEKWTDEVIYFWTSMIPSYNDCIDEAVLGTAAIFMDEHPIEIEGKLVWGYSYPWSKYIYIGSGDTTVDNNIVAKIFAHELSHVILYACSNIIDEEEGHAIFRQFGAPF